MLMYQKSMFDRYYCIKAFFRWKTLEKVLFTCTYNHDNGAEKHVTCERFENAASRQDKRHRKCTLRPKTIICVFQVSRPYLGFYPDLKHFIVNCEQNVVKFAGKWENIY